MGRGETLGLGRLREFGGGVEEGIEGRGTDDADVDPGDYARELSHRVTGPDEHAEKDHDARHRHRSFGHRDAEDLGFLVDDEPGADGD